VDEIEGTASSHDLSEFWREHFADRRQDGYPSFEEMLVLRRGFTLGLGDRPEDHEGERGYAEAAWAVVSPSMPDAWFDRFEESPLGSPFTFDLGGRRLSGGAVVNGLTASRIGARCEDAGLGVRPLRVLEIGAGYGQVAHQLIQALEIESYSICDLPENLLLSAFYLQGTFSERGGELIGPGDTPTPGAGLVFTVPPFLERLEGPFDLIVNSYSFQEMNRESVDEYFDHARRNLADDGVFYSLNAHGKAGIERPSQYPVEQFRLASVSCPPLPLPDLCHQPLRDRAAPKGGRSPARPPQR
jgi:SAM-dependent methyltransferase